MSPERAKILIIDDSQEKVEMFEALLKIEGHTIVEVARSKDEAEESITHIEEKGIEVVLIDGNLSTKYNSGRDGKEIVEKIKEKKIPVKTVGISSFGNVEGVDINWDMGNPVSICDIVREQKLQ